jgi:hypothetical protein
MRHITTVATMADANATRDSCNSDEPPSKKIKNEEEDDGKHEKLETTASIVVVAPDDLVRVGKIIGDIELSPESARSFNEEQEKKEKDLLWREWECKKRSISIKFQADTFLSDLYRFKIYIELVGGGEGIFAPESNSFIKCGILGNSEDSGLVEMAMGTEGRVRFNDLRAYYAGETVGSISFSIFTVKNLVNFKNAFLYITKKDFERDRQFLISPL